MKNLTIKKNRFLDWYFDYGQDAENTELRTDLAEIIIKQMYKKGFGSCSVEQIFNSCNKDSIRLFYTCQFENLTDSHDLEISDLKCDYKINLID